MNEIDLTYLLITNFVEGPDFLTKPQEFSRLLSDLQTLKL